MPIIWQPINALSFLQRGNDAIRRAEEAVREGKFRLDLKSIRIVSPILHPGQVICFQGVSVTGVAMLFPVATAMNVILVDNSQVINVHNNYPNGPITGTNSSPGVSCLEM